jgi:cytidylate kinase
MIISISGKPGAGKSTIAKMLAGKLGYKRYYMGGLLRKMAAERGLTLEELNAIGEKDFFTDEEIDRYQKELGEKEDNFVIEGRTAYHFIPHSLKIFLDVDEKIGAERILFDIKSGSQRYEAKKVDTPDDLLKCTKARMKSDQRRYQKYYKQNVFDPKHFDLIVDTSHLSVPEVFERVYQFVQERMKK